MLKWMRLKNLALVEEADVEFGPGFNVITGETGAGKSVIMGAVGLLLGARADKSSIRSGAEKCEISAEFSLDSQTDPQIRAILEAAAIDLEDSPDSLLVRRVITASSTRNFIHSSPVSLQVLRDLGALMIDIHAANENQSLIHNSEQLRILDRFAGLESRQLAVAGAWEKLQQLCEEKQSFLSSMPSSEETARMRRDADEIERAAPVSGEDDEIKARHTLASNSKSILEIASQTANALVESDDSLFARAKEIRRVLIPLERIDEEQSSFFLGRCDEICQQIDDLSSALSDYASSVDLDESDFLAMEERMHVLQTLKRRYGPSLEQVLLHLAEIQERIAQFDHAELARKEFDERERALISAHRVQAGELSEARKSAAKKLVVLLSAETRKLGFQKAEFEIQFDEVEPGPKGFDRIQILFTANPGVPLKPLRDVASSGEISRVMLAMKTVLAEADSIPILIFDEVDANIGGETAMKVGAELAKLAREKQVICISHLPQVAHYGNPHFLVSKSSDSDTTLTQIRMLDPEERLKEIARMFGGGKAALDHAKSMLESATSAE